MPARLHLPQSLPILSIHLLLRSVWGTLQALSITPLNQVQQNLYRHIKFQLYEFAVLGMDQDSISIKDHNGILVPVLCSNVKYTREITHIYALRFERQQTLRSQGIPALKWAGSTNPGSFSCAF